ncbi:MAG TPA: Crp/Fnr family transcriptional regulator [Pirellulales bacterium]|nr:Crp/Fnr family transcriptional regulator [Pirellulales bacterium]
MTDLVNPLRGIEFFHDIAQEHLQRITAISKIVEFPAQYDIFHENEPAKDIYFVISGRVSLAVNTTHAGCRQLMEVGPGELIGWSPLVGRALLSDTARTLTPTVAVALDGGRILKLCAEDPQFGFEFMQRAAQTLASRLNATRLQLLELGGLRLPKVQIESD